MHSEICKTYIAPSNFTSSRSMTMTMRKPCCKQHVGADLLNTLQNRNYRLQNIIQKVWSYGDDSRLTNKVELQYPSLDKWATFHANLSAAAASATSREPNTCTVSASKSLTHSLHGRPTRRTYGSVVGVHVPGTKHESLSGRPPRTTAMKDSMT